MTRYQIKIPGGDLTDLLHEIALNAVSHVVVTAGAVEPTAQLRSEALYPAVFEACKGVMKKYVRGFHVCGCRPHCDLESILTELAAPDAPSPRLDPKSPPAGRYVLSLDIPLKEFTKQLETSVVKAVAENTSVHNWHKLLFPVVRNSIEPTLGKYVSYSPGCNRGEYICAVGVCTEFDPWERVAPKA